MLSTHGLYIVKFEKGTCLNLEPSQLTREQHHQSTPPDIT